MRVAWWLRVLKIPRFSLNRIGFEVSKKRFYVLWNRYQCDDFNYLPENARYKIRRELGKSMYYVLCLSQLHDQRFVVFRVSWLCILFFYKFALRKFYSNKTLQCLASSFSRTLNILSLVVELESSRRKFRPRHSNY